MAVFSYVYAYSSLELDAMGPYLEGGLHRPDPAVLNGITGIYSSNMVDAWTDVNPRPGEEYSVMELPTPGIKLGAPYYDERMSTPIRFIVALIGDTRLPDYSYYVYGWVDDIRVKIQKGQNRSIVIHWHPDWFLTLGATVTYGAGRILRGPQSLARPDPTEPRMWKESTAAVITDNSGEAFWVVVLYTENVTVGGKTYTQYQLAFWQNGSTVSSKPTPSIFDVYNGLLEEYLELDANSVRGAWVSPIRPVDPSSPGVNAQTDSGGNRGWYKARPGLIEQSILTISATLLNTSDAEKYIIVDPTGGVVASLPWGIPFDKMAATLDIGPAGCYMIVDFRDSTSLTGRGRGEGRMFSIPMISIPITENAMQSYVYSGEREYDKELRTIQKDQAAVNGIAGIGTSAIGGAIAGSMVAPGPGTVAGAIAGVVSGTVGTAVGYVSAGHFDRKTQTAIDKLKSNQAAGDVVSAGGLAWYYNGGKWYFVKMTRDSASAAELSAEQTELGYPTDSYTTSCASVILDARTNGGGLKIEGLEVFGANVNAGKYISGLFARGVHIDKDPL